MKFAISDTGVGIEPIYLNRIFQPYFQTELLSSRKAGGTGLGLAISQRLVKLMGGTITVDSQPGKGSTFSFLLKFPIEQKLMDHADAKSSKVIFSNYLNKISILIVDVKLIV